MKPAIRSDIEGLIVYLQSLLDEVDGKPGRPQQDYHWPAYLNPEGLRCRRWKKN